MPAAVIPIDAYQNCAAHPSDRTRQGSWSLFEIVAPAAQPVPFGILALGDGGEYAFRMRESDDARADISGEELGEPENEVLDLLADDLAAKARELSPGALLAWLEDTLSHFVRISERNEIRYSGSIDAAADRLFEEHVDARVRPFVTHLPLFSLRAAATKFGEGMASDEATGAAESWVRTPRHLRLSEGMFVAHVVGRSMEPLIPDGSRCVFRLLGAGSRQGKRVLIEKLGETDFSARYTIKRYTSSKQSSGRQVTESAGEDREWRHRRIRLEPLNPEFEAFDLDGAVDLDEAEFESGYRAIAEFIEVLPA